MSLLNTPKTTIPTSPISVKRALLSVSDKTGLLAFAQGLHALGVHLLSTGGTAKLLRDARVPVTEVADYTGAPEILDGRVKTLNPKIHGGLLARRDVPAHMETIATHAIGEIDLVVVNLYPFAATVARADVQFDDAIENIDIGGPAMLRSAAKNHAHVAVLCDPADYAPVLAELQAGGSQFATRFALAKKVFAHTAAYDGAISNFLSSLDPATPHNLAAKTEYPQTLNLQYQQVQTMRYGENPHQSAGFYKDIAPSLGLLAHYAQVQGKALSYNNIADADAAWECVRQFDAARPACVIVKHANPCGVAIAADAQTAYTQAFATDPSSSFGGIIAFNGAVDEACASAVAKQFAEVIIAPAFSAAALAVFATKPNLRILSCAISAMTSNAFETKRVGGGLLVQSPDNHTLTAAAVQCVTQTQPSAAQMDDLLFAWQVAKFVKSNAIVYCKDGRTLGIGAGQMSRVDSAKIAAIKAQNAGLSLVGCVVASDAFFPFRDGLDVLAQAGAVAVIQPGGSVRDDEVIAAANEQGVAMVTTGVRHFRH